MVCASCLHQSVVICTFVTYSSFSRAWLVLYWHMFILSLCYICSIFLYICSAYIIRSFGTHLHFVNLSLCIWRTEVWYHSIFSYITYLLNISLDISIFTGNKLVFISEGLRHLSLQIDPSVFTHQHTVPPRGSSWSWVYQSRLWPTLAIAKPSHLIVLSAGAFGLPTILQMLKYDKQWGMSQLFWQT